MEKKKHKYAVSKLKTQASLPMSGLYITMCTFIHSYPPKYSLMPNLSGTLSTDWTLPWGRLQWGRRCCTSRQVQSKWASRKMVTWRLRLVNVPSALTATTHFYLLHIEIEMGMARFWEGQWRKARKRKILSCTGSWYSTVWFMKKTRWLWHCKPDFATQICASAVFH